MAAPSSSASAMAPGAIRGAGARVSSAADGQVQDQDRRPTRAQALQAHAAPDAIAESVFASIEQGGELTDTQILALSALYERLLIPALDLVDRGKVVRVPSQDAGSGSGAASALHKSSDQAGLLVVQSATDPAVSYAVFWDQGHEQGSAGANEFEHGQESGEREAKMTTRRRRARLRLRLRQPVHCPCPAFTARAYGAVLSAVSSATESGGAQARGAQAPFAAAAGAQGSPFLMCKHLLAARLAERLGRVRAAALPHELEPAAAHPQPHAHGRAADPQQHQAALAAATAAETAAAAAAAADTELRVRAACGFSVATRV